MAEVSSQTHSAHVAGSSAQPAFEQLIIARRLAKEAGSNPRQYAVEIAGLLEAGATTTDLRWLMAQGLAEHLREATLSGATSRHFHDSPCLGFSGDSCFLLTELGEVTLAPSDGGEIGEPPPSLPRWSTNMRELALGETVVKRFRGPAPNQEAVLRAFEEEGWPIRMDDPLPPKTGQDSKRRLHDTINALNRNQKRPLVRFFGDGTGQGICWETR